MPQTFFTPKNLGENFHDPPFIRFGGFRVRVSDYVRGC